MWMCNMEKFLLSFESSHNKISLELLQREGQRNDETVNMKIPALRNIQD